MQAAPAVTVSVVRSGLTLAVLTVVGALAATSGALWAWQRGDLSSGLMLLSALGLVLAAVVAQAWHPTRQLRWDGEHWALCEAPGASPLTGGEVIVAIDLDQWLLLHFRCCAPSGRVRTVWLALHHPAHRAQWHALRCALCSPRAAEQTSG